MSLLYPLGLLLALALPILVVFYLLKVQPIDREVGSTYLWERLLPDLAAHQPWQKPRFPLLFFIQAAIIGALVLAVSRPAVDALAPPAIASVYVLDATASMRSTDVAPSRFEQAKALAREQISSLPDSSQVTLILAGSRATVLAANSGDRSALLAALESARSTDATGSVADALRLADSLVHSLDGQPGEIRVFTDAAFDWPAGLPPLASPVKWNVVGEGESNLAITGFGARAAPDNARRQQLFARAQRFGSTVPGVTLDLKVDGRPVESRELTFDERGVAETVFDDLPDGARLIEARLAGGDLLSSDDRAYMVLERPREVKVLLVTRGNVFLERSLALVPGALVDRTTPRRLETLATDGYDLLVLDGEVPDLLPTKPLLLVGPTSSQLLVADGQLQATGSLTWDREHPLMRHVDLADVRVFRAPRIVLPEWGKAVVRSLENPLVIAGEVDGRRVVVLGPDLRQTNLPLTPAFPILIANAIGYLEPPGFLTATSFPPGADVELSPPPDVRQIAIRLPSGETRSLPVMVGPVVYRDTAETGLYSVSERDGDRVIGESAFAVNLLSAAESNLQARELPAAIPAETAEPRSTPQEGRWAFLSLGLLGLVGEWWWYHRRE